MAKTKEVRALIFALLTLAAGSYTFGEFRIEAGRVNPVQSEAKDLCPEGGPVEFFETITAAEARLTELRSVWERKPLA